MNTLYNTNAVVIKFLEDLFRSETLVNQIELGDIDLMNLGKYDLFPLVHIWQTGMLPNGSMIEYSFEITVVTERNFEPNKTNNLIDNLNETSYIVTKAINYLKNQRNPYRIKLVDSVRVDTEIYAHKNVLDGQKMYITVQIPNTVYDCSAPSFNIPEYNIVERTKSRPQIDVTASTALDNSYNNAIVKIKDSCTITIPSNLTGNFSCLFRTYSGVQATFVGDENTSIDAPSGLKLEEFSVADFYKDGDSSTYILQF